MRNINLYYFFQNHVLLVISCKFLRYTQIFGIYHCHDPKTLFTSCLHALLLPWYKYGSHWDVFFVRNNQTHTYQLFRDSSIFCKDMIHVPTLRNIIFDEVKTFFFEYFDHWNVIMNRKWHLWYEISISIIYKCFLGFSGNNF